MVEPVLVSDKFGNMSMAFDGSNIAVSWSDEEMSSDPGNYHTVFIAFPWNLPEAAMESSVVHQPTNMNYSWLRANSKPHAHPLGFLLLTSTIGNSAEGPDLLQTLWDQNANLLDGPHFFYALFPDEVYQSMDPNGWVASDGTVTTGSLKGIGFEEDTDAGTGGEVVLDVDRWNSGGYHERLVHQPYDWPDTPGELDEVSCSASGQNVYLKDDSYSILAVGYKNQEPVSHAIVSQVSTGGEVISEPTEAVGLPPLPAEYEGFISSAYYTFSGRDDALLIVAKVHYFDPALTTYDPTIEDPFPVELWSILIDFNGNSVGEWVHLVDYESHVFHNKVRLSWSGRYFGACYNDPYNTFEMIIMNGDGEPVAAPIDLFWEIPPVENLNLNCDIIAVEEDTFVAVMSVYTEPESAYAAGLWATRVDVSIPIE